MPAVNTSGFNVGVMPNIQFADPRLLAPNYGAILPAVSQGFQLADQIQGAPIRRQLAQIQLQQAQDELAQTPLRRQLAQIQIQEARKKAAIPDILPGGSVSFEDVVKPEDLPAEDENGNRTGPIPTGELVQIKTQQAIGPNGEIVPVVTRTTVKTAEQREAERAKEQASLEAMKALATSRTKGKDFEYSDAVQKYQDAVDAGDTEAAQFYKSRIERLNMQPGIIAPGVNYQRRVEQLAADAGITLERAAELSKTPEGAAALAQAAVVNKAAARSPFGAPVLTAQQKAMLSGEGAPQQDFASRVNNAFGQIGPAATNAPTFNSVEEAEAAGKAGLLKPGTKIIVGGRSATWQ